MALPESWEEEALATYTPEVVVCPTPEEVDLFAANEIIDLLASKHDAILTLPTGSTPKGMYWLLLEAFTRGEVSFRQASIFNLDEYWPLSPDHPASYAYYMRTRLINHIDIPPENWFIPNGAARDPEKEAARFESLLREAGGIDLAVLGIGPGLTCHIGFNEPGSNVNSRTRYVELNSVTLEVNSQHFPNPAEIPQGAITQGVANILEAKRVILLAKGAKKAESVARALEGSVSPDCPASFLRYHHDALFVVDAEAAARLNLTDNS